MKAAVVARQATLFGAGRDSAGGEQGAGTGMREQILSPDQLRS